MSVFVVMPLNFLLYFGISGRSILLFCGVSDRGARNRSNARRGRNRGIPGMPRSPCSRGSRNNPCCRCTFHSRTPRSSTPLSLCHPLSSLRPEP